MNYLLFLQHVSYRNCIYINNSSLISERVEEPAPLTNSSSDCNTVLQRDMTSSADATALENETAEPNTTCDADELIRQTSSDTHKKNKCVSFAGERSDDVDVEREKRIDRKGRSCKRRSSEDRDDDLSISLKPIKRGCASSSNKGYSNRHSADSGKLSVSMCQEISVSGEKYLQLDGVIGRGASSSVCRVMHMPSANIYAFKRVDVRSSTTEDAEEVLESYANEINLLNQCKGSSYIIDLITYEINRDQMFVAMVMEMGEIDLATSIAQQKKAYASDHPTSSKVNPFYMRMVWERMLLAVDFLHQQRIVHGDLKPANFVFVKGQLKLIDFGISREISGDTTNIVRTGIIGTVNYMAPEAVMPSTCSRPANDDSLDESDSPGGGGRDQTVIKHGRASDIWSLGCILYQMLYGKTPFSSCRNPHQKIMMIANPKADIPYEPIDEECGIEVAKMCLVRDVARRATIRGPNGLLSHAFLSSRTRTHTTTEVATDCIGLGAPSQPSKEAEPYEGPHRSVPSLWQVVIRSEQ